MHANIYSLAIKLEELGCFGLIEDKVHVKSIGMLCYESTLFLDISMHKGG